MKVKLHIPSICILLLTSGCGTMHTRVYETFTEEIDANNQLQVSMNPASNPKKKQGSTSWMEERETYRKLNFQVFIMEKDGYGKNPHVESVTIHSFSYQMNDGNKTEILSDYGYNFWMQGNSRYNKNRKIVPPITYVPKSRIKFWIEFTLNGKKYSKQGTLKSFESKSTYSTHMRDIMM